MLGLAERVAEARELREMRNAPAHKLEEAMRPYRSLPEENAPKSLHRNLKSVERIAEGPRERQLSEKQPYAKLTNMAKELRKSVEKLASRIAGPRPGWQSRPGPDKELAPSISGRRF